MKEGQMSEFDRIVDKSFERQRLISALKAIVDVHPK